MLTLVINGFFFHIYIYTYILNVNWLFTQNVASIRRLLPYIIIYLYKIPIMKWKFVSFTSKKKNQSN